ncbi:MAG: hypothetical protein EOP83_04855, partial [Verrucomicrobiaceae bacterium]
MRVAVVPAIFLTTLRLAAQEPEVVLPEVNPAPAADAAPPAEAPLPIAPVPVPEGIQLFPENPAAAGSFGIPEDIHIRDEGPSVEYDAVTGIVQFSGPFHVTTDNDMTLRSDKARWNQKELKFFVDG